MIRRAGMALLRRQVRAGHLTLHFGDGSTHEWGAIGSAPRAEITVASPGALKSILLGGSLALTESYMKGDLDTPDLAAFFRLAALNQQRFAEAHPRWYAIGRAIAARITTPGDQPVTTMAGHYNLGNEFYAHWLDPTMTYSSARFAAEPATLEQAQLDKYRAIASMADLRPGQRILEIGTGWGTFAIEAARLGCHVTTLTISEEQLAWAEHRISDSGLGHLIDARLLDYRDIEGRFDRVVSIEMIESIDHLRWPDYFETIARVLEPGGFATLQAIVIDDDFYAGYVHNEDFIRRYIFPGGMLPSPEIVRRLADQAGLQWEISESFGADYARTLEEWHAAFDAAWPSIEAMGFDDRFRRMWKTYLAYCQAGFEVGRINVMQLRLVGAGDRPSPQRRSREQSILSLPDGRR